MTSEDPPSAAAEGEKKPEKKKRVIVTPPCPPSVSTGYMIVRGVLQGLVGASMDDAAVSVLQPTYIKDKVPTGKFSINFGKKLGSCELDLPETKEAEEALWDALETALKRVVGEDQTISYFSPSKDAAMESYGAGIFDAMTLKKAPADLKVGYIGGTVLCVVPSVPLSSTGKIKAIVLDRKQCGITAGKKARKAEITVKFQVEEIEGSPNEILAELSTDLVAADEISNLRENKIRFPEGRNLVPKAQEKEVEKSTPDAVESTTAAEDEEMVVNAWEVKGKIDYNKLVDQFGSTLIDDVLMDRIKANTVGKGNVPCLHRFLRRGMFFSHRDMTKLLDSVEKGKPMYLYTGRGPSSASMHLGHLIPFLFTKWLQEAFDVPLVIQMTDDEKFLFKGEYSQENGDNLDHYAALTIENAKDIIACGFKKEKTFLFSDLDYVGRMYPNIVRIWKAVTANTVNGIFGFDGSANIGKVAFPAIQAAPSFASTFPKVLGANRDSPHCCLIPCAIDQDPYFRMTRDIAHKMVSKDHALGGKPSLIHSKFFPPLQGATGKMSSSDDNSAIFLTDSPEQIERKIKNHAFSGGQETKKLQEELGADLDADVSYQWLRFFLDDDEELEKIGKDYKSGSGDYWSTGKVKARLIEILKELVAEHQERRAKVTEEEVREWMAERSIL